MGEKVATGDVVGRAVAPGSVGATVGMEEGEAVGGGTVGSGRGTA